MKRRFRLTTLRDCPDGTRFWFALGSWKFQPFTLITSSPKRNRVIFHSGHAFNLKGRRFDTGLYRSVWVESNES